MLAVLLDDQRGKRRSKVGNNAALEAGLRSDANGGL
jgi:hypothetical protein